MMEDTTMFDVGHQFLPGVRTQFIYPDFGNCRVPRDLGISVFVLCPLKDSLSCDVLSRPVLAVQSSCIGCPYIGDVERYFIRENLREASA